MLKTFAKALKFCYAKEKIVEIQCSSEFRLKQTQKIRGWFYQEKNVNHENDFDFQIF